MIREGYKAITLEDWAALAHLGEWAFFRRDQPHNQPGAPPVINPADPAKPDGPRPSRQRWLFYEAEVVPHVRGKQWTLISRDVFTDPRDGDLLNDREVALLLGLSPSTVRDNRRTNVFEALPLEGTFGVPHMRRDQVLAAHANKGGLRGHQRGPRSVKARIFEAMKNHPDDATNAKIAQEARTSLQSVSIYRPMIEAEMKAGREPEIELGGLDRLRLAHRDHPEASISELATHARLDYATVVVYRSKLRKEGEYVPPSPSGAAALRKLWRSHPDASAEWLAEETGLKIKTVRNRLSQWRRESASHP